MPEHMAEDERACTIGLDLGTSNVKAVAFAADGATVAQAHQPVTLRVSADGAAEEDPRAVYDAATETLATVARAAQAAGYRVARVGLSAAMHSLCSVAEDGTPLLPAQTWMDTRAQPDAERLWASPEGPGIYARTGTQVHGMAPLAKLLWLRRTQPAVFTRADRFVSLKEWLWQRWFGVWEVDASLASATGLYCAVAGAWDEAALASAAVEARRLSTVVPTTTVRRGLREPHLLAAGLTPETPFVLGASDGVLANLGMGALTADSVVLTLGTSGAVRMASATMVTDAATRPFCYVLDAGRFVVGSASNSGGVVLEWLAGVLAARATGVDGLAHLLEAAATVEVGDLYCLPYVAGERTPLVPADARGAFIGLHVTHTDAHLMRAAVEGVLCNAYTLASSLFALLGRPQRVLASGGVLALPWIRQLTADLFGLPVVHDAHADASVLGAGRLACIATGALTWEAAAAPPSAHVDVHTPRPHHLIATRYARFEQLRALLLPPI